MDMYTHIGKEGTFLWKAMVITPNLVTFSMPSFVLSTLYISMNPQNNPVKQVLLSLEGRSTQRATVLVSSVSPRHKVEICSSLNAFPSLLPLQVVHLESHLHRGQAALVDELGQTYSSLPDTC